MTISRSPKTQTLYRGMLLIGCLSLPSWASLDDVWSNRVENNYTVDGDHWGLGGRYYMNYDVSQFIVRYKFDSKWSSQYRYVTSNKTDVSHWFRLQHKSVQWGPFFLDTRIEQRIQESKDDVFRIRPQTGFKFKLTDPWRIYYILEPHWEYDYGKKDIYYKFAQHFIGFDYQVKPEISLGLFLEIDTDDSWEESLMFLGTNLAVKIK